MIRIFFFIGLITCAIGLAIGQEIIAKSPSDKPSWIANPPGGYLNDYFVGEGESRNSLPDASKEALSNAIRKLLQTKSFEATSRFSQTTSQNGNEIQKRIVDEIVVNGSSVTVKGLVQEESYYETWNEQGAIVHRSWILMRVPKQKDFKDPPTKFSPVWRSALLPVWGQFYKGEPTKGYIFAFSEALLIPAGFVFSSLKTTAEGDARSSRTQALRDYYNDQADTYYNLMLGSFIAAGAVYIYNIVDAAISDGEKVYVDGVNLRIEPIITKENNSFGMKLKIIL